MWEAVGIFIHNTLGVSERDVDESKVENVRRIRAGRPGGIIKDEAMVIFHDPDVRDLVAGHARNLAGMINSNKKPTAGIRTEVPFHLRAVFKMLEDHGKLLRQRYGEDFKRHVKFDDLERTFCLNVRLPGDQHWSRISADFVRRQTSQQERSAESIHKFGGPRASRSQGWRGASLQTAMLKQVG